MQGIGVSQGIGIGKIFYKKELTEIPCFKVDDMERERKRFRAHVEIIKMDLQAHYENNIETMGKENAEVFLAHKMMLEDPEWLKNIELMMTETQLNAEHCVADVSDSVAAMFEALDNEYMKERATDIRDIKMSVIASLMIIKNDLSTLPEGTILAAYDLTPSDTAMINPQNVIGFITEIGGETSHSAIIARSLGIPAVMGISGLEDLLASVDEVIIDGNTGKVLFNPTIDDRLFYSEQMVEAVDEAKRLQGFVAKKAMTKEGIEKEFSGNIALPKEVDNVIKNGGEGIGLFRSEFLFMEVKEAPTEDKQYEAYVQVLDGMGSKPVIIRTMDIGGDKEVSYLEIEKELNPFLGYRAIRYCLDHTDILKTQLRALYRASVHGCLRIMFPMVSTVKEIRLLKALVERCKEELTDENKSFSETVELGIMIEVPSAALMADHLAKEVDFFSIGTNDLTQYTLAADRMNAKVRGLYANDDPAVIRLIKMTIDAAHKENKWVGMCGSAAGKPAMIPLLLGLGLDEFSMSPNDISKGKEILSQWTLEETKKLAEEVMTLATQEEVNNLLNKGL